MGLGGMPCYSSKRTLNPTPDSTLALAPQEKTYPATAVLNTDLKTNLGLRHTDSGFCGNQDNSSTFT